MGLNEIFPDSKLCPTDSRLRPDIRKLEEGDLEGASLEKHRLEEQQRRNLKSKPDVRPQWFEKEGTDWIFTGEYWTSTKSHIISIF